MVYVKYVLSRRAEAIDRQGPMEPFFLTPIVYIRSRNALVVTDGMVNAKRIVIVLVGPSLRAEVVVGANCVLRGRVGKRKEREVRLAIGLIRFAGIMLFAKGCRITVGSPVAPQGMVLG